MLVAWKIKQLHGAATSLENWAMREHTGVGSSVFRQMKIGNIVVSKTGRMYLLLERTYGEKRFAGSPRDKIMGGFWETWDLQAKRKQRIYQSIYEEYEVLV